MRQVMQGSVDQSVILRVVDSITGLPETGVVFNTAGADLWYRREGGLKVSITEATLAAANTAHADGGFIHIGDGYCRLDLPDAAYASGSTGVLYGGAFTDMLVIGGYVQLVGGTETPGVVANGTALASGSDATHIKLPGTVLLHPGMDIEVWAGTGAPWNRLIEAWDNATRIATIATVSTTADDTTVFRVWSGPSATDTAEEMAIKDGTYAGVTIGNVTTVGEVTGAVASVTAPVVAGTVNDKVEYSLSAAGVQAIWDALTSALTMVGSIGKRIVDDNTAAGTSLSTIAGLLDTEVAAIKAKTDNLPADPAATGDAMTLTSGERISIAAAVGARTIAELAVIPGATPSADQAAMLPYMGIRNKRETTATNDKIHNDAGAVIATASRSDDNITGIKSKYTS